MAIFSKNSTILEKKRDHPYFLFPFSLTNGVREGTTWPTDSLHCFRELKKMFEQREETDPLIAEKETGIRIRITDNVTSVPKLYNFQNKSHLILTRQELSSMI